MDLALNFLFVVKDCEEAFDRKTEFNGTSFVHDIADHIVYYEKMNMIWFV